MTVSGSQQSFGLRKPLSVSVESQNRAVHIPVSSAFSESCWLCPWARPVGMKIDSAELKV